MTTLISELSFNIAKYFIIITDIIILLIVLICYGHRLFHAIHGLFCKKVTYPSSNKKHKYGYLITARNEENVIGYLIDSIKNQNYPQELMRIFVVADNCTDKTAEISRNKGAIVFERFNKKLIGKSYALELAFKEIMSNKEYDDIEAFILFDADNLLSKEYTNEINKAYDQGNKVIASFRHSKNFSSSWVAAGQSIFFYYEMLMLHRSRASLNMGTAISGTGFLIDRSVMEFYGGWIFHTLIEDVEFSLNCAVDNIKIAFCEDAVFYDEQPSTAKDSFVQRMRWCKGLKESFFKYTKKILSKKNAHFNQLVFELLIQIAPVTNIPICWAIINVIYGIVFTCLGFIEVQVFLNYILICLITIFVILILNFWFISFSVIIKYNKIIKSSKTKKFVGAVLYPLFMLMYLPISIVAQLKNVEWVPTPHKENISIDKIEK